METQATLLMAWFVGGALFGAIILYFLDKITQ